MLTQERLKELLHYDPETGVFTWVKSNSNRAPVGALAGSIGNWGYRRINVDGVGYAAQNLAWLYMTGKFPTHIVDHRDRVRSNNVWSNLRAASRKLNAENRNPKEASLSGQLGVTWDKLNSRWVARITHNHQVIHLGRYDEAADAIHVRQAAERLLFNRY